MIERPLPVGLLHRTLKEIGRGFPTLRVLTLIDHRQPGKVRRLCLRRYRIRCHSRDGAYRDGENRNCKLPTMIQ
jgi:hypothetical protein